MKHATIALAFLLFAPTAYGTDLISMAHKAGFNSCDNAIKKEFSGLTEHANGVASTGYFNNRSFSIMATWGKEKDSVWKNTTLIKFGRRCLSYSLVGTTFPSKCEAFQAANSEWQVVRQAADFTWTQNQGGVNALLKDLPNNSCAITYRIHQSYDIDAVNPVRSVKGKNSNGNNNG
ncbi:hypothetical protein [Candidatus Sororendozoicomonas aggregata]|uniref:hypothetical protein n=1 Tax=Candidatus Sororendozoicomonas aggregata TaxID=3073239 RepID=UPI002ED2A689